MITCVPTGRAEVEKLAPVGQSSAHDLRGTVAAGTPSTENVTVPARGLKGRSWTFAGDAKKLTAWPNVASWELGERRRRRDAERGRDRGDVVGRVRVGGEAGDDRRIRSVFPAVQRPA